MDINKKAKKPWYKKWWVWVIIVFVVFALIQGTTSQKDEINKKVNNASDSIDKTTSDAKDKIEATATGQQYKHVDTWVAQNVRGYSHYVYTGSGKPSTADVEKYMAAIVKHGCDADVQVCNYFLWDSQDAYDKGNDSVRSGTASEVASKNKDHLIGYVNSGYAFYYYGTSPSKTEGGMVILDPDTGKYTDMNS
jgi:hypothetical protein